MVGCMSNGLLQGGSCAQNIMVFGWLVGHNGRRSAIQPHKQDRRDEIRLGNGALVYVKNGGIKWRVNLCVCGLVCVRASVRSGWVWVWEGVRAKYVYPRET